jgi:hypothetical protein
MVGRKRLLMSVRAVTDGLAPAATRPITRSEHCPQGASTMRRLLTSLPLLSVLLAAAGCEGPADKTRAAVLRVLKADEALSQEMKRLPSSTTPSQFARAVGTYCDGMERIETADCPADFRVAFRQHARAWRETEAPVRQLPDGFVEGFFLGIFNAVLRGEGDGGVGRLQGELKRSLERVRVSWEEVERVAAKYGAAL